MAGRDCSQVRAWRHRRVEVRGQHPPGCRAYGAAKALVPRQAVVGLPHGLQGHQHLLPQQRARMRGRLPPGAPGTSQRFRAEQLVWLKQ